MMRLCVFVLNLIVFLFGLTACDEGPDPAAGIKKYLPKFIEPKVKQPWRVKGINYDYEIMNVSAVIALNKPFDEDFNPKPDYEKKSVAIKYCPPKSERQKMNMRGWKLNVVLTNESGQPMYKLICPK